jgi:hypothetical protein
MVRLLKCQLSKLRSIKHPRVIEILGPEVVVQVGTINDPPEILLLEFIEIRRFDKDTGNGIPTLERDRHGFVTGLEILSDEFFDLFVGHEDDLDRKKPSPRMERALLKANRSCDWDEILRPHDFQFWAGLWRQKWSCRQAERLPIP